MRHRAKIAIGIGAAVGGTARHVRGIRPFGLRRHHHPGRPNDGIGHTSDLSVVHCTVERDGKRRHSYVTPS